MITDKKSIQQLQFRSNLPRLDKEDLFIFAQLEPEEQKKSEDERIRLIIQAYTDLLKNPSSASLFDNPLTSITPKAYKLTQDSDPDFEWLECLYEIQEDRNPYTQAKMKIFKKAFVYFDLNQLRSIAKPQIGSEWKTF